MSLYATGDNRESARHVSAVSTDGGVSMQVDPPLLPFRGYVTPTKFHELYGEPKPAKASRGVAVGGGARGAGGGYVSTKRGGVANRGIAMRSRGRGPEFHQHGPQSPSPHMPPPTPPPPRLAHRRRRRRRRRNRD